MRVIRRKQNKILLCDKREQILLQSHSMLDTKGGEGRCKTNNTFQYVFYAISKGLFICIINCWWVICRVLICSLLLSPRNVILCRLNKTSKWFLLTFLLHAKCWLKWGRIFSCFWRFRNYLRQHLLVAKIW